MASFLVDPQAFALPFAGAAPPIGVIDLAWAAGWRGRALAFPGLEAPAPSPPAPGPSGPATPGPSGPGPASQSPPPTGPAGA